LSLVNRKIAIILPFYTSVLVLVIIFLLFGLSQISQPSVGQTNKAESTVGDWIKEVGTIIGVSSVISGGISAVVNHFFTKRQIKAQHENAMNQLQSELKTQHDNAVAQLKIEFDHTISQLKEQRQVEMIQDKLNLYSSFIYHLKKMTTATAFRIGTEPVDQITETIHEIDALLKTKFYLLSSNTNTGKNPIMEWMEIRGDHRNLYNMRRLDFENQVNHLRQTLVEEYNQEIIPEIEQITGRPGIIKMIID